MHDRFGLTLCVLALSACTPVSGVENAQVVARAAALGSTSYTFPNGQTVVFQVLPGLQERTRRPATGLFVDYGDARTNLRLAASSEVSALECGHSELNCENPTIKQASGTMAFALRRLASPQSEYDILVSDDRSPTCRRANAHATNLQQSSNRDSLRGAGDLC